MLGSSTKSPYGSLEASSSRSDRRFQRDAIASMLLISCITLIAAGYAAMHAGEHRGSAIDLLQVQPNHIAYVSAAALARMPEFWEQERKMVGEQLVGEMQKEGSDQGEPAKEQDAQAVAILRRRYSSIMAALQRAQVLKRFPGPNGEMRVVSPSGAVYQLYEYHVPGGYPDAPLDLHPGLAEDEKHMGEPFKDPSGRNPTYQGEYPEYRSAAAPMLYEYHDPGGYPDAPIELHKGLAEDEKHMGEPFADPSGRNPLYQGEYPEYKAASGSPMLYEYHVPGGYPDAELDLHKGLAVDEKTMGEPFADPAGRSPTYQGEYPEYKAAAAAPMLYEYHVPGGYPDAELDLHKGLAVDEKTMGEPFADPSGRNPLYQGEYPEYKARAVTPMLYDYHDPGGYPDAPIELHKGLAEDEKHMGEPFADPSGRNPLYQGEYPEYKATRGAPMLYEYHVPGGYPDAELDLHKGLAVDEKTMGEPFADPAGRSPTYQGEYPEYKARVSAAQGPMLYEDAPLDLHKGLSEDEKHMGVPFKDPAGRNPTYQGVYPEYFVVADSTGQLRLVSARMIRGMRRAPRVPAAAVAAAERRAAERREEEEARRPSAPAATSQRALLRQLLRSRRGRQAAAAAAAGTTQELAAAPQRRVRHGARRTAAAADPRLTPSATHSWNTVYDPALAATAAAARRGGALLPAGEPAGRLWGEALSPAARRFAKHYAALADQFTDVADPAKVPARDRRQDEADGGAADDAPWVAAQGAADQWWQHNHAGRGY